MSALERLQKKLYRKNESPSSSEPFALHPNAERGAEDWQEAREPAPLMVRKKTYTNTILVSAVIFFAVSVGISVFIFLGSEAGFTPPDTYTFDSLEGSPANMADVTIFFAGASLAKRKTTSDPDDLREDLIVGGGYRLVGERPGPTRTVEYDIVERIAVRSDGSASSC